MQGPSLIHRTHVGRRAYLLGMFALITLFSSLIPRSVAANDHNTTIPVSVTVNTQAIADLGKAAQRDPSVRALAADLATKGYTVDYSTPVVLDIVINDEVSTAFHSDSFYNLVTIRASSRAGDSYLIFWKGTTTSGAIVSDTKGLFTYLVNERLVTGTADTVAAVLPFPFDGLPLPAALQSGKVEESIVSISPPVSKEGMVSTSSPVNNMLIDPWIGCWQVTVSKAMYNVLQSMIYKVNQDKTWCGQNNGTASVTDDYVSNVVVKGFVTNVASSYSATVSQWNVLVYCDGQGYTLGACDSSSVIATVNYAPFAGYILSTTKTWINIHAYPSGMYLAGADSK